MPILSLLPKDAAGRLLAVLLLLLSSCVSSPDPVVEDEFDYESLGPATREGHSIGKYLADLSTSMSAWMEKTMNASTSQDREKQSLLEINIRERVRNRQEEIQLELETGPTQNRITAAAALGFSSDPAMLSPLLAALDDPNEKVVGNAILGLTMLNSPDTPMERIGELVRHSANPKTRWSAANCVRSLVEAGADGSAVLDSVRAGLTDLEEPMVRSQCALTIALTGDAESIPALDLLLYDPVPLVSRSAAKALSYLGRTLDTAKGDTARALVGALTEGDRELSLRVHPSLTRLSHRDFGMDEEAWTEWALRLP
jgi:hypothetical protein